LIFYKLLQVGALKILKNYEIFVGVLEDFMKVDDVWVTKY